MVRSVRFARLVLVALVAAWSQACLVVALHPIYEPDSIAFEPALIGIWASDEDNFTAAFERGEWHSYHLVLNDNGKMDRLSARLTRISDEMLLLDVTPLDGTEPPPMTLPVHMVARITLTGDSLSVAFLNYDRFDALAKTASPGIGLTMDGEQNAVLTASTPELRTWLLAHAADEGLFAAPTTLKRHPPAPTP
jgi:hypothetical protein